MVQEYIAPNIKCVPPELTEREAIRALAGEAAGLLDGARAPTREALEVAGAGVLRRLGLPERYLGYAMVAVSNARWQAHFASVPFGRRLFLLPRCLSHSTDCAGCYDAEGLHCAGCGACAIDVLRARAAALGYQVVVAEGTTSVVMRILEGQADALLGVACLDSLEKTFTRVAELGIPHLAIPLLTDGCEDTTADIDEILALLELHSEEALQAPRGCLPLLRETVRAFADEELPTLLAPYLPATDDDAFSLLRATDDIALDWLRQGGKRLRPFLTIAGYAVARHGEQAMRGDTDIAALIPTAVKRLALAIEALHKASLVHDDIEDDDAFRYGCRTLHQTYGIAPAINVGDYLVGLGYRLIAGEAPTLGMECVADILNCLSAAHLELCRGQGAELLWSRQPTQLHPRDVLAMYALKTAPAFEVALYAGLRAAGAEIDRAQLKRLAIYLGEGYQIRNDLDDWRDDQHNKVEAGGDARQARPTLLRAFALEAGGERALVGLTATFAIRDLYRELGAFTRAEQLLARLRARALEQAGTLGTPALNELLQSLVRIILPEG